MVFDYGFGVFVDRDATRAVMEELIFYTYFGQNILREKNGNSVILLPFFDIIYEKKSSAPLPHSHLPLK